MRSSLPFLRTLIKTKFVITFSLTGLIMILQHSSLAAIQPINGAVLNYVQVLFEYDEVMGSDHYVLSISQDQKTITIKNTSLACIVPGLQFGKKYTWHYEAV